MNEESAFRGLLTSYRRDWVTMAAYADWLQERDDPRGFGVAAMAALKLFPYGGYLWFDEDNQLGARSRSHVWSDLPSVWFAALTGGVFNTLESGEAPGRVVISRSYNVGNYAAHAALDAAAAAFVTLPSEVRLALTAREPITEPED